MTTRSHVFIRAADRTGNLTVRDFAGDVIAVVSFLDPLHFEIGEVQDTGSTPR